MFGDFLTRMTSQDKTRSERSSNHVNAADSKQEVALLSSVPPPALGRDKIGRYEIIYPVAAGGMATVYVARLSGPAGFEKLVAIKVIHPHLATQQIFVDMFLDEARLAAGIHHPNVGEIFETGKDGDLYYIVGEFIRGHDVSKLLRRLRRSKSRLSQGMLAQISAHACNGLHAAHEATDKNGWHLNLVHRDVSPNNILISYDGFVKVIDFGVAWAHGRIVQTETGAVKGKIGYMSPEQITGKDIDRRSDIFSMGVVLYLTCTAKHPFRGSSAAEKIKKIMAGNVTPPSRLYPDIDSELERIILTAMAPNPKDRFSTASEMATALEAFAHAREEDTHSAALAALMDKHFKKEKESHDIRLISHHAISESSLSDLKRESDSDECSDGGPSNATQTMTILEASRRWPTKIRVVLLLLIVVTVVLSVGALIWTQLESPVTVTASDPAVVESEPSPTSAVPKSAPPPSQVSPVMPERGVQILETNSPVLSQEEVTPVEAAKKSSPGKTKFVRQKKKRPLRKKAKPSGSELIKSPYQ